MEVAEVTSKDLVGTHGPLKGKCCIKPGDYIKGTFFLGGAGLDGIYIPKLIKAFHQAGIKSAIYLDRDKWSAGTGMDATIGVFFGRDYDPRFPMLLRANRTSHKQFNLIGYSYGSLIAAQLAAKYAQRGSTVDYLVLIGSPISENFLKKVQGMKTIKKVIVINLDKHGDPLFAGMEASEIALSSFTLAGQMIDSSGHFYYAEKGTVGDKRRKQLAEELFKLGLR
jgi:pimeloyl-ACP methyl ester carboxylesterase